MYVRNVHRIYITTDPLVYTGFCVWGGGPGSNGPVWVPDTFFIVEIKNSEFFHTRKFSINVLKNSMKNYIF